jgi:hypothetical protein
MTVIICPAPDDRVEHLYQELLFSGLVFPLAFGM